MEPKMKIENLEMKNLKIKNGDAVSAVELRLWIGEIAAHAASGVLVRAPKRGRFRLKRSVQNVCERVRKLASGRGSPMANERLRVLKGRADLAELKCKFDSGEMLDTAIVERQWSGVLSSVRAQFMALPSRIAAQIPHMDRREISELDLEVRDVLTEAADDHSRNRREAKPQEK
jgi:phage terminase Nu1 subunit (DNA packaging protein)